MKLIFEYEESISGHVPGIKKKNGNNNKKKRIKIIRQRIEISWPIYQVTWLVKNFHFLM